MMLKILKFIIICGIICLNLNEGEIYMKKINVDSIFVESESLRPYQFTDKKKEISFNQLKKIRR